MAFKRTSIRATELILVVEDVITTSKSVKAAFAAVMAAYGYIAPVVGALVNRSGLKMVDDKGIIALIDHPMPMWTPEECPLCKKGSEAIRPKGIENWTRLNANY